MKSPSTKPESVAFDNTAFDLEIEQAFNQIPKDSTLFVEKSIAIADRIKAILKSKGIKQQ
jgi:hypothetical protein